VRVGETDRPKGQHRAPAPPYLYRLEAEGFECVLADAKQVKNLPGRPKRVDHTAWLEHEFYGQHREGVQFLQQHGLVTADRPGMQPSDDVIFSLRLRYWGYETTDDPAGQSDAASAGRAGERS